MPSLNIIQTTKFPLYLLKPSRASHLPTDPSCLWFWWTDWPRGPPWMMRQQDLLSPHHPFGFPGLWLSSTTGSICRPIPFTWTFHMDLSHTTQMRGVLRVTLPQTDCPLQLASSESVQAGSLKGANYSKITILPIQTRKRRLTTSQ